MGYQGGLMPSTKIAMILVRAMVILSGFLLGQARAQDSALEAAQHLLDQGKVQEGKTLLAAALQQADERQAAHGLLVGLAIAEQDKSKLEQLFQAQQAYPYAEPSKFFDRVQYYELLPLRGVYNEAVQAALSRQWRPAQQGFYRLLGDAAFHRSALVWLFRMAMQQREFEQAQFIAGLADKVAADPAASQSLLEACAAQRRGERATAMRRVGQELRLRGAYARQRAARLEAQRAVYLAMIRLHVELDQCFLGMLTTPAQAKPLFPDLEDSVLSYLARR